MKRKSFTYGSRKNRTNVETTDDGFGKKLVRVSNPNFNGLLGDGFAIGFPPEEVTDLRKGLEQLIALAPSPDMVRHCQAILHELHNTLGPAGWPLIKINRVLDRTTEPPTIVEVESVKALAVLGACISIKIIEMATRIASGFRDSGVRIHCKDIGDSRVELRIGEDRLEIQAATIQ